MKKGEEKWTEKEMMETKYRYRRLQRKRDGER